MDNASIVLAAARLFRNQQAGVQILLEARMRITHRTDVGPSISRDLSRPIGKRWIAPTLTVVVDNKIPACSLVYLKPEYRNDQRPFILIRDKSANEVIEIEMEVEWEDVIFDREWKLTIFE